MSYIPKIVVFDLDETLGYFQEYGILWNSLTKYLSDENIILSQTIFNNILDLYPEFIRPDILPILNYLKTKKKQGQCNNVMIFTNNQAPKVWSEMIQCYFDKMLNYSLFDKIIGAFKINGKIMEMCRTCNGKNINDLLCCTKLPSNTEICFIDDVLHSGMISDNVYYINVKPYVYSLPFETVIERLLNSKILHNEIKDKHIFKIFLLESMNKYKNKFHVKSNDEYNIDKILSKKILEHLHTFFKTQYPDTTIKKNKKINKTRKIK
jgi:hypothetical protein